MPLSRAFDTPGSPPKVSIAPRTMELWESLLRMRRWFAAPAAPPGTLDNRGVLELMMAGRSDDEVLADIRGAPRVRFALDKDDMIALSKAGMSWRLINAMRAKAGLCRSGSFGSRPTGVELWARRPHVPTEGRMAAGGAPPPALEEREIRERPPGYAPSLTGPGRSARLPTHARPAPPEARGGHADRGGLE